MTTTPGPGGSPPATPDKSNTSTKTTASKKAGTATTGTAGVAALIWARRRGNARPDAKPRVQGAATAMGAILVLVILRSAARRMPPGGMA